MKSEESLGNSSRKQKDREDFVKSLKFRVREKIRNFLNSYENL